MAKRTKVLLPTLNVSISASGNTVRVYVPCAGADSRARHASAHRVAALLTETVLCCGCYPYVSTNDDAVLLETSEGEDVHEVRIATVRALTDAGYQIGRAS